jgi:hypothetical protein
MKLGKYEEARLTLLSIDMKGARVLDEAFKETLELKKAEQKKQAAKLGNKGNAYGEHIDTTSYVSQVITTLKTYEMYSDD